MKNKGFTLIELMAVIIVLGVLATLIVPKVVNMLNEAEKNTNMSSAEGLVKAATYKATNNEITGNTENIIINYSTGENTSYLDYSGNKPTSGKIAIKSNGEVAMAVRLGDNCYLKSYISDDITVILYNTETCDENAEVFTNYELPQIVTTGDGLYKSETEPGRFVYRGATPNNYITLNEGTTSAPSNVNYRIISYEPDGTIKVIRDASIGSKAFDERDSNDTTTGPRHNTDNTFCNYSGTYYGCNVWGNLSNTFYNGATLGSTFNYKYYANNTYTELTNSTNTGTVTVDSTLNQYLNNTWITDKEMSKYIDNHDFNVGGVYYTSSYTGGDKGLQKEKSEEKLYTWNGKIGLMNITDYVETSLNPTCTSVYSNFYYNTNYYYESSQHLTGYDNWPCSNRTYNWLPKQITEWSLSPYSVYRIGVWSVSSAGYFLSYGAYSTYGVRPVFYLKSQVKLGGFGTSENPFYIIES